jgi:urease accessory protein
LVDERVGLTHMTVVEDHFIEEIRHPLPLLHCDVAIDFSRLQHKSMGKVELGLAAQRYQRSSGRAVLRLSTQGVETLREEGAAKIRLPVVPRGHPAEAIAINTAGGLTGGDEFAYEFIARAGASLIATTQAAEKVYRAKDGMAQVDVRLRAEAKSRLFWLPQETILFEASRLRRHIEAEIAADAELLLVEPLVLGRTEMGERDISAAFSDRWRIKREGKLVFAEDFRLDGALPRGAAALGKSGALATLLLVAPNAERRLEEIRQCLGDGAGVSAWDGKLVARILAKDGFTLRKRLIPALKRLVPEGALPRIWSL